MVATIHDLHPVSRIGEFLRLGHTGHRKLEDFHESGRFAIDRVVVDAAHIVEQKELIDSLRSSGKEIILDTRVAELSTPGGFTSSARKLPWALESRPYAVEDFSKTRISEFASEIANFAIEHQVDAILAPTRPLMEGPRDPWLAIDIETCEVLRNALDVRGAATMAIDFPLLLTYQNLLDGAARKALIAHIRDLPFDNLWQRIANFGVNKSAAGIRKYINALRDFHELEKPIVSDGIGGLPALGIVAFGAAGGICHGVAEKESFNPPDWWKPRNSTRGGGPGKRVYFEGLDAYLKESQARALLSTRNAKPLLGCRQTGCCPGGWEDMILNPKVHFLNQTTRRLQELAAVPDMRRPDHFLSKQLAPVDRIARNALRLKVNDVKLRDKVFEVHRKTDDMRHVLEELYMPNQNLSRSFAPLKRGARSSTAMNMSGKHE